MLEFIADLLGFSNISIVTFYIIVYFILMLLVLGIIKLTLYVWIERLNILYYIFSILLFTVISIRYFNEVSNIYSYIAFIKYLDYMGIMLVSIFIIEIVRYFYCDSISNKKKSKIEFQNEQKRIINEVDRWIHSDSNNIK